MKFLTLTFVMLFCLASLPQESEAGWGRRSSFSRSRSSRSNTTTRKSNTSHQSSKPTQTHNSVTDSTPSAKPVATKPAAPTTSVRRTGGSSLVPLALLYVATRPSHSGSSSRAAVPNGCACNEEGVPSPSCPKDVKCEANPNSGR